MRKKYVIANFKMNKIDSEIDGYMSTIIPLVVGAKSEVMLAVPNVSIKTAVERAKGSNVVIAGQNLNENDFGALTGEVNAEMLAGVGAGACIVGHSERRNIFGETNEVVNKKVLKALKSGLVCVLCIGETLYDRKNNLVDQVLQSQISDCLSGLYANELKNIVIAYEPIWAIGSGSILQPGDIEEAIRHIRKVLSNIYDDEIANGVSILYGGSVTDGNAKEISKIAGVDGVLVGGASLVPEKFGKIVSVFSNLKK
jgi:triosephosphate isomerase (TIM)